MREFLRRFLTDRRWFVGTIIVIFVFFLFFWKLVSPERFVEIINGFFQAIWGIIRFLFVIAVAILGIRVMLGYRPWWARKKKK